MPARALARSPLPDLSGTTQRIRQHHGNPCRSGTPIEAAAAERGPERGDTQRLVVADAAEHKVVRVPTVHAVREVVDEDARDGDLTALVGLRGAPDETLALDWRHRLDDRGTTSRQVDSLHLERGHLAEPDAGVGERAPRVDTSRWSWCRSYGAGAMEAARAAERAKRIEAASAAGALSAVAAHCSGTTWRRGPAQRFPLVRTPSHTCTPDGIRTRATALRDRSRGKRAPLKIDESAGQRGFPPLAEVGNSEPNLNLVLPQRCQAPDPDVGRYSTRCYTLVA
jgi:hypothetical protein